jgi:nucleosome binding factor SPN SPT16 subunit
MGFVTNHPWERKRLVSSLFQESVPESSDIPCQDLLFSNVKHLFFQPCDHELLVILHIHLKAPIMIGKKKTYV